MSKKNAGSTLISLLFFMVVLALMTLPAISYYDSYKDRTALTLTNERLDLINKTIAEYVSANGRYPCPAPITAPLDDATGKFGQESNECQTGSDTPSDDTKRAGEPKTINGVTQTNFVRSGAVPVRTLGLPDHYIYDGYENRFVYTITEAYTTMSPLPNIATLDNNEAAGIYITDTNDNKVTRVEGNAIFAVMSMGNTNIGAYSASGDLLEDCNDKENCNMDARLETTINKSDSTDPNTQFTQNIRYETTQACISVEEAPDSIAYLMDTSGSMAYRVDETFGYKAPENCPPTGNVEALTQCWRVHMAQWAIRRALLIRQDVMKPENDPDGERRTFVTGFPSRHPQLSHFNNSGLDYNDNIDTRLQNMCPEHRVNGDGTVEYVGPIATPIGDTMLVLAQKLYDGEPNRLKRTKIIVFSDGAHTGDADKNPIDIVPQLKLTHPNLQIDLIDMDSNYQPALRHAIEAAGGQYIRSIYPPQILEFIARSTDKCVEVIPTPPVENYYCQPVPPPVCDPATECCPGEVGYPTCDTGPVCDPATECCEGEPGYPTCDTGPVCNPATECCPGETGYPNCGTDVNLTFLSGIYIFAQNPGGQTINWTFRGDLYKILGYNDASGAIDYLILGENALGPVADRVNLDTTPVTISGTYGDFVINPNGTFTYNATTNRSGRLDSLSFRATINHLGPRGNLAVQLLWYPGGSGYGNYNENLFDLIRDSGSTPAMNEITLVEYNGEDYPMVGGQVTINGTYGTLRAYSNGNFVWDPRNGPRNVDGFYFKGPRI